MIWLELNKKYLEQTIPDAYKESVGELGDTPKGKETCLWTFPDKDTKIDEISSDGTLEVVSDSPIGFINLSVKLTEDDMISLAELLVKRLNKLKAVMESLK